MEMHRPLPSLEVRVVEGQVRRRGRGEDHGAGAGVQPEVLREVLDFAVGHMKRDLFLELLQWVDGTAPSHGFLC
jgi:hypothetical protein